MSVTQEIQRIAQAKADIRNAITAKGVKIADTDRIDTYAAKIGDIQGGSEGSGKYRVRFFDYDGTILKTVYTDGGEVTAPAVPEHERLLFQEWNNDFDNVTSDLDVGAIYTTKSGKCEFDVWINELGRYTMNAEPTKGLRTLYMGIRLVSGTVTIEWGDGQVETLSTIGTTRLTHAYAESKKYTLMISGSGEWTFPSNAFTEDGTGGTGRHDTYVVAVRLANISTKLYEGNMFGNICCCETVTIAKEHTDLNSGTFSGCEALRHLNFPRAYYFRGEIAKNCKRLRHIVIPETLISGFIGRVAFSECGLMDIVLPKTVTTIGDSAFCDNSRYESYQEVTIPQGITKIDNCAFYAFNGASFLRKVRMKATTPPAIYLTLGRNTSGTFASDGSLKEIIVPAGCGEAYKSATNWSYYADIIKEEEI